MKETFQYIFTDSTLIELGILFLFVLVFLVRMVFLFLFSCKILFAKNKTSTDSKIPVSILITLRNEEKNITENLPELLQVQSDMFEVVVVDDFSQDNSLSVLGILQEKYKKLKVSFLSNETRYSSKLAQNIGLKAARFDWILTVPVSSRQFSVEWIETIAQSLSADLQVLVNYSNAEPGRGFFNHLYRVERFFQQLKSFGYLLNGIPVIYSEDNVAFQRNLYFNAGGFKNVLKELYASLELIFNKHVDRRAVKINASYKTAIRFSGQIKKTDFLELLKKYFVIENHLGFNKKIVLFADEWTRLFFVPLSVVVIFLFLDFWQVIAGILGIPFLAYLLIIKTIQNRLKEPKIFISSLVFQLIMPYFKALYKVYFNRKRRKQKWKKRS